MQRISENQFVGSTWMPNFYGYDGHGSVRFLTNSPGAVTDSYDYDAFGMPIRTSGTTPNVFLYSGERSDSSIGLYDLRARYYNQATGRFWARDPVEGKKCCGLSWNPYIYTRDNPVNLIDPTGRQVIVMYVLVQTVHFVAVPEEPIPVVLPDQEPVPWWEKYNIEEVAEYGEKIYQAYELGECQEVAYESLAEDFGLLFDRQLANGAVAGRNI